MFLPLLFLNLTLTVSPSRLAVVHASGELQPLRHLQHTSLRLCNLMSGGDKKERGHLLAAAVFIANSNGVPRPALI